MSDIWLPCECDDPECRGYRLDELGAHPFFVPFDKSIYQHEKSAEAADRQRALPFGILNTSSWEFDGERTDLNDVLAVLWGLYLRCSGIANVAFLSERGFMIASEISSRAVIPVDWGWSYENWEDEEQKLLLAKTSVHMHHFIQRTFYETPLCNILAERKKFADPYWLQSIRKLFSLKKRRGFELQTRNRPQWTCLTAIEQGLTVVELSEHSANVLKSLLGNRSQQKYSSDSRISIRDNQLTNAVDQDVVDQVKQSLAIIDQVDTEEPFLIAMSSNVVGIGQRSLVSIATECGRSIFNEEQMLVMERREHEANFFMSDVRCVWNDKISANRFETMIGDLLKAEKGVVRVRQVGSTSEADDGRDFIAEWIAPQVTSLLATQVKLTEEMLSERADIVVQVKIRSRGVGRSDARGIRDTIEHHDCAGMLFVAFPNITTTLNDHLQKMRRQGYLWIDWWNRTDIEDRLRRNIDIAKRYEDVVTLEN